MIQQGDTIENKRTGQRMTFLQTWKETNGTQLQIECFSPQSTTREPEHYHPYQENRFKIISGKLCFKINGKELIAVKDDVISIPKNVPHHFWNPEPATAHYIQEFFPALQIDVLFETFFALSRDKKLNKNGSPNIFRAALIMLRHEKEIRLAKPGWFIQKMFFRVLARMGRLLGYSSSYQ